MTETSTTKSDSTAPLRLEGELTIYNVESWRARIMERLSQPGDVTIDLSGVEKCDCAGLQLLCSARKGVSNAGKGLLSNLSPSIRAAAENIGLDLSQLHTPPILV